MSLKPPEQFRHPKNLVMIRLNIMLVKRVRTKSLELKPFLLPSYSFRRAGMVQRFSPVPRQHFIQHIPGRHIPTYEKDTHSSSRGCLLTNLPTSSQSHRGPSNCWLIHGNWARPLPSPFRGPAELTADSIVGLLLIWPRSQWMTPKMKEKKIIHFIPDPINNSDLNTNTFQAHLPPEWHLHHIDVTTFISLSVPSCHISKCYFHERRTHTAQSTAGSSHWPLDEKGVTWKTWENCSYSLLCILLKQCCPVELKFTNRENK